MADVLEPVEGGGAQRSGLHSLQSDEYSNVWWCVPLAALGRSAVDEASVEQARRLLRRLKLHADPILRARGWRVKHLIEHVRPGPSGMCYHDGEGAADISIRLRSSCSHRCNTFLPFRVLLGVMLHEIAHIGGHGVDDIHPPEFYEELDKIRRQHRSLLAKGVIVDPENCGQAVSTWTEDMRQVEGGCRTRRRRHAKARRRNDRKNSGSARNASDSRGGGSVARSTGRRRSEKLPPLGRKFKMIDKRTREGKRMAAVQQAITPAEAARAAALQRFGQPSLSTAEMRARVEALGGGLAHSANEVPTNKRNVFVDEQKLGAVPTSSPSDGLVASEPGGTDSYEEEEIDMHEYSDWPGLQEEHDGPPGLCDCAKCQQVAGKDSHLISTSILVD